VIDARINVALGFVTMAISNWILAGITTPQADFGTFVFALFLSGLGLSQLFVPLSLAVLGSVGEKDVPATSAFFNLSRQVGGSIATAVLVTILLRGIPAHQTELAATTNLNRPGVATFLQDNGGEHSVSALNNLEGQVTNQAAVLSYADTSRWTAIITFALAPLVLLLSKPRLDGHVPVE
jgi:DHA2 family multidrug resistance protein